LPPLGDTNPSDATARILGIGARGAPPQCVSPVDSDGDECEYAGGHGTRRDELDELAVEPTERPVVVQQEDEVEHGVEDGHESVGDGQVHQEVVGDGAHALVAENDPDYDEVAAGGHHHHGDEHGDERHLTSQTTSSSASATGAFYSNKWPPAIKSYIACVGISVLNKYLVNELIN